MNFSRQHRFFDLKRFKAFLAILLILLALPVMILLVIHQISLEHHAATNGNLYYVSKNGNNADGKSWTTAWNELNQINWSVIQPGDTILLDGGTNGMTYTTTLSIGKGGLQELPIAIQRATGSGHNGQVILLVGVMHLFHIVVKQHGLPLQVLWKMPFI